MRAAGESAWLSHQGMVALACAAIAVAVSWPAVDPSAKFVYDDFPAVLENEVVWAPNETSPVSAFAHDYWGDPIDSPFSHKSYRPVTTLTFRWNVQWLGRSHASFAAVNVALHGLCVILVASLAGLVFGPANRAAVVCATLLFAVHPVHTEVVAAVHNRAELLAAVFTLLSFLCYARAVAGGGQRGLLLPAVAFALLATLSKETGIAVLGIELVYDIVWARTPDTCVDESKKPEKAYEEGEGSDGSGSDRSESSEAISDSETDWLASAYNSEGSDTESDVDIAYASSDEDSTRERLSKQQASGVQRGRSRQRGSSRNHAAHEIRTPAPRSKGKLADGNGATLNGFHDARKASPVRHRSLSPLTLRLQARAALQTQSSPLAQSITARRCGIVATIAVVVAWRLWLQQTLPSTAHVTEHSLVYAFGAIDNPVIFAAEASTRWLTILYLQLRHALLLLFPAQLAADYSGHSIPLVVDLDDPRNYYTAAYVLSVVALLLWATFSRGVSRVRLAVISAWLLLPFIPASNMLFWVGFVVAERVLYMPSIGFCLLLGYVWGHFHRRAGSATGTRPARSLLAAVLFFSVIIAGWRSHTRMLEWRTGETLWRSAVDVLPNNEKAHRNLAAELARRNVTSAAHHYLEAIRINPEWPEPRFNLATMMMRPGGNFTAAETQYREVLRIDPLHADALNNLGALYLKQKRFADASDMFAEALLIDADNIHAGYNLGHTLLRMGQLEAAVSVLRKVALRPMEPAQTAASGIVDRVRVHWTASIALSRLGRHAEARAHLLWAIRFGLSRNTHALEDDTPADELHHEVHGLIEGILRGGLTLDLRHVKDPWDVVRSLIGLGASLSIDAETSADAAGDMAFAESSLRAGIVIGDAFIVSKKPDGSQEIKSPRKLLDNGDVVLAGRIHLGDHIARGARRSGASGLPAEAVTLYNDALLFWDWLRERGQMARPMRCALAAAVAQTRLGTAAAQRREFEVATALCGSALQILENLGCLLREDDWQGASARHSRGQRTFLCDDQTDSDPARVAFEGQPYQYPDSAWAEAPQVRELSVESALPAGFCFADAHERLRNSSVAQLQAMYTAAVKLDPTDAEAWARLGGTLLAQGRRTRADEFGQGTGRSTRSPFHVGNAEAAYNQALSLDPDNPTALNNLARIEYDRRNYDQAERNVARAIAASASRGVDQELLKANLKTIQLRRREIMEGGSVSPLPEVAEVAPSEETLPQAPVVDSEPTDDAQSSEESNLPPRDETPRHRPAVDRMADAAAPAATGSTNAQPMAKAAPKLTAKTLLRSQAKREPEPLHDAADGGGEPAGEPRDDSRIGVEVAAAKRRAADAASVSAAAKSVSDAHETAADAAAERVSAAAAVAKKAEQAANAAAKREQDAEAARTAAARAEAERKADDALRSRREKAREALASREAAAAAARAEQLAARARLEEMAARERRATPVATEPVSSCDGEPGSCAKNDCTHQVEAEPPNNAEEPSRAQAASDPKDDDTDAQDASNDSRDGTEARADDTKAAERQTTESQPRVATAPINSPASSDSEGVEVDAEVDGGDNAEASTAPDDAKGGSSIGSEPSEDEPLVVPEEAEVTQQTPVEESDNGGTDASATSGDDDTDAVPAFRGSTPSSGLVDADSPPVDAVDATPAAVDETTEAGSETAERPSHASSKRNDGGDNDEADAKGSDEALGSVDINAAEASEKVGANTARSTDGHLHPVDSESTDVGETAEADPKGSDDGQPDLDDAKAAAGYSAEADTGSSTHERPIPTDASSTDGNEQVEADSESSRDGRPDSVDGNPVDGGEDVKDDTGSSHGDLPTPADANPVDDEAETAADSEQTGTIESTDTKFDGDGDGDSNERDSERARAGSVGRGSDADAGGAANAEVAAPDAIRGGAVAPTMGTPSEDEPVTDELSSGSAVSHGTKGADSGDVPQAAEGGSAADDPSDAFRRTAREEELRQRAAEARQRSLKKKKERGSSPRSAKQKPKDTENTAPAKEQPPAEAPRNAAAARKRKRASNAKETSGKGRSRRGRRGRTT